MEDWLGPTTSILDTVLARRKISTCDRNLTPVNQPTANHYIVRAILPHVQENELAYKL
jgi:hypothetical protein